jgi:two-component system, chemotaxis family, CheB/CheR fusion protein
MAKAARRTNATQRPRTQQTPARPAEATSVPVVVIGSSAGGLEPISEFLAAVPSDAGLAIVVIQHLDPTSKSMLPQLLARRSALDVSLAKDGCALEANKVYVIPPAVFLTVASGTLRFSPAHTGKGARLPINVFLHSLAADRGRHGIGIIMSGTGTDGAEGLKALKEAGGLVLVQDPNEAQQDGMPRCAMEMAHPDYVLPVRAMPAVMHRYVSDNYVKARHPPVMQETEAATPIELLPLVEVLKSSTGLDFGHYKSGTLQRRIERRFALNGVGSWTEYLEVLRNSPTEADALAKDLLISVTGFFRDHAAFSALGALMPELLRHHAPDQPLRIWVAGCSTGEEAYSLGILALEQIAAAGQRMDLQLFATDVDEGSLQIGRTAIYPESIQADLTPDRLEQFFLHENGHFRVGEQLRKAVIFSRHDALHDPPFSRLDLVSCRNVLIYLLPEAQRHLVTLLHFALRDGGLLFLGAAESLGTAESLFEPVYERLRIYRRRGDGRMAHMGFSLLERGRSIAAVSGRPGEPAAPRLPSLQEMVQRTMLETYAPAAVVTNRAFAPLYFFGAADRYLQIAQGEPNQDLLSIAREGLRPKLREAITRAFRSRRRIATHNVWLKREGRTAVVTIVAQRLGEREHDLVLVSFLDELPGPRKAARSRAGEQGDNSEVALLRQQLTETRRELNRTIHDLRQTNEDLKGKNEEAMSLNEEFLSTNEELESSKEELQSLNEEVTTVNVQLRWRLCRASPWTRIYLIAPSGAARWGVC